MYLCVNASKYACVHTNKDIYVCINRLLLLASSSETILVMKCHI